MMILALACDILSPKAGVAYTAAGDRTFPALLILPQVTTSDAVWGTAMSQPLNAGNIGDPTNESSFTGTFSKTITERFGIQLSDGISRLDRLRASPVSGFQNLDLQFQYEMILDQPHEFVLSLAVDRQFARTGDHRIAASDQSATQPSLSFAKGLNKLPFDYAAPLAVTGFAGYQIAEAAGRPNTVNAGLSIQYSIPYLVSHVDRVALPSYLRGMTPIVELLYSAPEGPRHTQQQTMVVAPGVSYTANTGWELGVEAMIPTNRATGRGVGIIAQVVVQLDYLLAGTAFGRPIFAPK